MICTADKCVTNIIAFLTNWQLFLLFIISGKGLYNTEKGSHDFSACLGCEAGRYSAAIGLKNSNDCVNCPPGKIGTNAGAQSPDEACFECPIGW